MGRWIPFLPDSDDERLKRRAEQLSYAERLELNEAVRASVLAGGPRYLTTVPYVPCTVVSTGGAPRQLDLFDPW